MISRLLIITSGTHKNWTLWPALAQTQSLKPPKWKDADFQFVVEGFSSHADSESCVWSGLWIELKPKTFSFIMSGTQKIRSHLRSWNKYRPAMDFKWLSHTLILLSTHSHALRLSLTHSWFVPHLQNTVTEWAILLLCLLIVCVCDCCMRCIQCSAAMHDPSLSHNRPLTHVLIPHGNECLCVCVCDAQCGPSSAAEVVTCGVLERGPEMRAWLLSGGFSHASSDYWRDMWHFCMKLVVLFRKNIRPCASWCVFLFTRVVRVWETKTPDQS